MSNYNVDSGKKSDENSTDVEATFSCEKCDQKFNSTRTKRAFKYLTLIQKIFFFIVYTISDNRFRYQNFQTVIVYRISI